MKALLVLSIFFIGLGCSTALKKKTPGPEFPTVKDALAREAKDLKELRILADDNGFGSKLLSKGEVDIQFIEGGYNILIPLGSRIPIQCSLAKRETPPSIWLSSYIEKIQEKIKGFAVHKVDAGVVGDHPFISLEIFYDPKASEGQGMLKSMAFSFGGYSLLCVHDQVGYRDTFNQVVSSLVRNIELNYQNPLGKPFYRQVSLTSVEGINIGYLVQEYYRKSNGEVLGVIKSPWILLTDKDKVKGLFDISVEYSNEKGELKMASFLGHENESEKYQIRLVQQEDGKYKASGNYEGGIFDRSFSPKDPLLSTLRKEEALMEAISNDQRVTISFKEYLPYIDPKKLFDTKARPKIWNSKKDEFQFEINIDQLKVNVISDSRGKSKMNSYWFGKREIRNTRIHKVESL